MVHFLIYVRKKEKKRTRKKKKEKHISSASKAGPSNLPDLTVPAYQLTAVSKESF